MGRSLTVHSGQCKSHAVLIYGQCAEVSGEQGSYLCFLLLIQHCVKVNKTVAMGAGEQQLWQQDTDWDVDVDRPSWPLALPAVAPGLSPTDTLGHFLCTSTHADIHSSRWVFTATCWFLLICFSSGQGGGVGILEGLCWTGRPVKVGKTFTHATWKPCLTDCTRPGRLFTLSRCGLPLVFLSNYPSLSESMCQSNSLESQSRAWARAEREGGREGARETYSLISTVFESTVSFQSHY